MWVYSIRGMYDGEVIYSVGFYNPEGVFISESDHNTAEKASQRVHYLNGGSSQVIGDLHDMVAEIEKKL